MRAESSVESTGDVVMGGKHFMWELATNFSFKAHF